MVEAIGLGVSLLIGLSMAKVVECSKCKKEIIFKDTIVLRAIKKGDRPYYICKECGKILEKMIMEIANGNEKKMLQM